MRIVNLLSSLFIALVLTTVGVLHVAAQDSEAEDKSHLIEFVENKISTETRQIRLNGIQGTLSSNVSFESITISDQDGVWLRIVNPQLVWSRRSLLLGRLQIESLTAERIEWPRLPPADESAPAPESTGFEIPELPVAVNIDELSIDEAEFGEAVFGLASTLRLNGSLNLSGGNLDTQLQVVRLDGPGGELALDAAYDSGNEQLDLDFSLQEPEDGIVANLLNIPDRPPVSLQITGSGAITDLDVDLTFDAGDERIAQGTLSLNDTLFSEDRRIQLVLNGPIEKILPEQHRAFFGEETSLNADVTLQSDGGTLLNTIKLDSGALDIAASGTLLQGGFPAELKADISLGSDTGDPVRLPLPGAPVTVAGGKLALRYGTGNSQTWSLDGDFSDFKTTSVAIGDLRLEGGGAIRDARDPEKRFLSFDLTGAASEIMPDDEGLAKAIGDSITFSLDGDWQAGQPVKVAGASLVADTARARAQGVVEDFTFKGSANVKASNLAAFSVLAGRTLGGSTSLEINGDVGLAGGGFDLMLDGSLTDAELGSDAFNRLLEGETTLSGRAARTPDGLKFDGLTLQNPQMDATIDGSYATDRADIVAEAVLNDISTVTERGSGRLSLNATVSKPEDSAPEVPYDIDADLRLTSGKLMERSVPEAELGFAGRINGAIISGDVTGSGQLGGEVIEISGSVDRGKETITISDFLARVGLSRLAANLTITNGLADGEITIDSTDISALAALALVDASGAINGNVVLSSEQDQQDVEADVRASGLKYQDYRLGEADIKAAISDAMGQPLVDADIRASSVEAAGIDIETLSATAASEGDGTQFKANATLENGTEAEVAGRYQAEENGFTAVLDALNVKSSYGDVRLTDQATVTRSGDTTTIEGVKAEIAGGTISAAGTIGDKLDLQAQVSEFPLSIVNSFRPDLGLDGTLNGSVNVSGTADRPQATFDMNGSGLTANALSSASIAPIVFSAKGSFADNVVQLDELTARNSQNLNVTGSGSIPLPGATGGEVDLQLDINDLPLAIANGFRPDLGLGGTLNGSIDASGTFDDPRAQFRVQVSALDAAALRSAGVLPIDVDLDGGFADNTIRLDSFSAVNGQNLNITGSGTIPLPGTPGGQIDVNANINRLPLAIANGFRPELGLSGTLDGTVSASGALDNPRAQFTLQVAALDAAALRSAGVAPINATASGSYQDRVVELSSLSAQNSQNLNISASGTIPVSGSGLAVDINGSVPLAIGESLLADRGTQLDGTLRLDARVTGAVSSPSFDGLFSLSGASVTDPLTNIRLTSINGMAGLRGDAISINQLSAKLSGGGTIGIGGTIGLTGPLPADLTVRLENAVYTDARTFKTTASGTLTVSGGLTAGPLIGGTINLDGTEITIPETLAGDADLLAVEHINPDAGTLRTLARIQAVMPRDSGAGPSAPVRLDITVNSPNQIFVRGRGIDAEFGGTVRVTGPLNALQPVGAFNLIRGRLSILNKRLDLTEGSVTLTGSLDPLINIIAQVQGDDITAFIQLSGRASDLKLVLSASPELPQDEILARVIFGKSLTELSPLQIANLAVAAASLVGDGGGESLSEQLRQGIGVDDLDVVQDSEGNVAVRAGKYIQDNVYLDVQAGAGGGEASINLDVTDSLTAKGTVDTDGNSKLGIFYEKDY